MFRNLQNIRTFERLQTHDSTIVLVLSSIFWGTFFWQKTELAKLDQMLAICLTIWTNLTIREPSNLHLSDFIHSSVWPRSAGLASWQNARSCFSLMPPSPAIAPAGCGTGAPASPFRCCLWRLSGAAAADAEWNAQENGKPSSTEYIGMRSLHQREGPENKEKMENSYNAIKN